MKGSDIHQALQQLAASLLQTFDLSCALQDQQRFAALSLQAPHVFADLSKQLWDESVLAELIGLARARGLEHWRQALLTGEVVNATENRPALHALLRAEVVQELGKAGACSAGVTAMLELAGEIRASEQITDVVHIGIGGSGLGPELALQALRPWHTARQRVHVVSNMDGHDLQQVLQGLEPARTLFVLVSKSWSTAETQRNMISARAWFEEGCDRAWAEHCVAITARPALAAEAGVRQVLPIPDGIGGRFSLWSAVGLPVAVAIGEAQFVEMLAGGAEMDVHFAQAPLERNLPVWLGLLDVWCSSFLQLPGRCAAPYHHGLRRLPAYLQQLEMESNGKRVKADGSPVELPTTGMVWGEPGSNGQHAFFQWLHQGAQRVPVEFIVARCASHELPEHQAALLANALAQAQALALGAQAGPGQLPGHQDFPGNRPSSFFILDELNPRSLGALLAMYEHRVFVAGVVWGINSFDQWGVELGKTLAKDLRARMDSGDVSGLDASTAGLLGVLGGGRAGR